MLGIKVSKIDFWDKQRIKNHQIEKYLQKGDFIFNSNIDSRLKRSKKSDSKKFQDILDKSLSIQTLNLDETAYLLSVSDSKNLEKMKEVAFKVKKKVYDNRIVTFAPLYLGNFCVNDCSYCGFRKSNKYTKRKVLSLAEIEAETKILAGQIGHKRLIVVYGEHPANDIDYMVDTIKTIYKVEAEVKVEGKSKNRVGQIRRVNVNAPPLAIEELKRLKGVGIGTYQVFQETYHRKTYQDVHPQGTIKSDYLWRLYVMHRALEAGVDDIGLGALFGLYDWRYEVMGLVAHNRELEKKFGIGAHTVSFPRLEPATNTPFTESPKYKVSDEDFKKLILVLRLSIPHAGMIITCRESPQIKKESIALGITQTDASSKIGIGSYSDRSDNQEGLRQQFLLSDTRSLEEVIQEFAKAGSITSFCTAGYRCGRTGECIMELLRAGKEGKFCKLNAVLTFREWLDDFASEETKKIAKKVINREIQEIKQTLPGVFPQFMEYYDRVKKGERDIYF
ncbi:MAG: [FeFe] hydrogenase H-cluster radical SAM maturase HydG [Omnitrophica bacterium]|nr:[FeFe] hydrogenase H-cluster radical SAM maturase HydG [Candidatus Omnitrophota bacterium]